LTFSSYEPPALEVWLTLGLGLTVLSPYYRGFARSLRLRGDERLLDFGSGSGICTRHIAARLQRGGRLDCVDVSSGWIKVLRKTLSRYKNVSCHLGHITQLDLPKAAFDLVVSHFVLHDIPGAERPAVVQALGQRLKPAGQFILREPQGEGLSGEELIRLADSTGFQPGHIATRKIGLGAVYDACFIKEGVPNNVHQ
jgi:SAM-dependent methyltransferase